MDKILSEGRLWIYFSLANGDCHGTSVSESSEIMLANAELLGNEEVDVIARC